MQKLIQGIRHFQEHVFPKNRELFERLASGQSPEVLVIGCSDSRLALDLITQTSPGDLFVCRNAGNIVPPYGQGDAVSAAIEYAVNVLNVSHIVVCGHSDCGAMTGLLHPEKLGDMPQVKSWISHAEGARRALNGSAETLPPQEALAKVTKLNVRLQLRHLATHPHVFARVQEGKLQLHGWVYDIGSGAVEVWNQERNAWTDFSSISINPRLMEIAYA